LQQINLPQLTCRGTSCGYPRVKELVILITGARSVYYLILVPKREVRKIVGWVARSKIQLTHQHPRDVGLSPEGEAIAFGFSLPKAQANAPLPPTFFNPTYAKRFAPYN
jgi:hypothetical protein